MEVKPSIENSTVFVDENRKFTFGMELLVMNVGLILALGVIDNLRGAPSRGMKSLLIGMNII